MFRSASVKGQGGQLRWGYRSVATLGAWTFAQTPAGGTVTAALVDSDEFGLDQSPLVVVVPVGQAQWRWPVRELQRDGSSVTCTVGPQE